METETKIKPKFSAYFGWNDVSLSNNDCSWKIKIKFEFNNHFDYFEFQISRFENDNSHYDNFDYEPFWDVIKKNKVYSDLKQVFVNQIKIEEVDTIMETYKGDKSIFKPLIEIIMEVNNVGYHEAMFDFETYNYKITNQKIMESFVKFWDENWEVFV